MKEIVHLKGFKPSICNAFMHFRIFRKNKNLLHLKNFTKLIPASNGFYIKKIKTCCAFSLVEMLMALLVASLLMAALAPVMTRRMNDREIKVISEASNYDKDMIISVFTEDTDFTIPVDANQVRITLMGGGGAGGNALYGNKEFTSSQSFTVPDNVTKLRVFMVGAGGSGASGGTGVDWAYGSIPNTSETYDDYLVEGEHKVTTFQKAGYGAPELNAQCKASGETQWTYVQDESIKVPPRSIIGSTVKVTACGGGGGGNSANYGHSGGGGSGGFLSNKNLNITTPAIYVKIGGGGGINSSNTAGCYAGGSYTGGSCNGISGGTGSSGIKSTTAGNTPPGGNGSYGTSNTALASGGNGARATSGDFNAGNGGSGSIWAGGGGGGYRYISSSTAGSGAGGGAPTTISTLSGAVDNSIIFQVGGGGGGGGNGVETTDIAAAGGGGGAGGGYGGGGGGGGAGTTNGAGGTGARFLSALIGGGQGNTGESGYATVDIQGKGGGGGGGYGGRSGVHDSPGIIPAAQNIFGSEHCNGGKGGGRGYECHTDDGTLSKCIGYKGKTGALRLIYGGPGTAKSNAFKCPYFKTSYASSGGGGGAGQIWIGEIDVTPNQIINFNIGTGGARTTSYGSNGKDGTATSITVGSNTYSVSGGKGGKYETDDTYISNSGGFGGGLKTSNFNSSARYNNWLNLNEGVIGGKNGSYGNTTSNGADGGNGGTSYKLDGSTLNGGIGGSSQTNGIDAPSNNYGAGGGGGGGVTSYGSNPGYGGKGANGYVYIEWGGTNGSGGTIGEIVKKTVTNFDGDLSKRVMKIKIGEGGSNGNGEKTTINVISGGKNITLEAKGGLKGNNGTVNTGEHAQQINIPSNFADSYKEYVQGNMSLAMGQKGENDYGGMGGYLACLLHTKDNDGNTICTPTVKANDGTDKTLGPIRPGCGGSSIASPLYDSICSAKSTSANPDGGNGLLGAGGGGGAVLNKIGGSGGKGGNGFVILEYKSTKLD